MLDFRMMNWTSRGPSCSLQAQSCSRNAEGTDGNPIAKPMTSYIGLSLSCRLDFKRGILKEVNPGKSPRLVFTTLAKQLPAHAQKPSNSVFKVGRSGGALLP